jgi:hypothetical protein
MSGASRGQPLAEAPSGDAWAASTAARARSSVCGIRWPLVGRVADDGEDTLLEFDRASGLEFFLELREQYELGMFAGRVPALEAVGQVDAQTVGVPQRDPDRLERSADVEVSDEEGRRQDFEADDACCGGGMDADLSGVAVPESSVPCTPLRQAPTTSATGCMLLLR